MASTTQVSRSTDANGAGGARLTKAVARGRLALDLLGEPLADEDDDRHDEHQVWTHDVGRAVRVSERLDIGIVWVNDRHRIDPASPSGGFKDSGTGSENGLDSYKAYPRQQSLVINSAGESFDWFATVEDLRYF